MWCLLHVLLLAMPALAMPFPWISPNFRNMRPPPNQNGQHRHGNMVHSHPGVGHGCLFGRSRTHPRFTRQFRAYFPKPPTCDWPDNPLDETTYQFDHDLDHHHHDDMTLNFDKCPKNPNYNMGGKRYTVARNVDGCPLLTWRDTMNYCQSMGMQAVSFSANKDQGEAENLMDLLLDQNGPLAGASGYWTSGSMQEWAKDIDEANTIEWTGDRVTKEMFETGSGFWAPGQPDNRAFIQGGSNNHEDFERCVAVKKRGQSVGLEDEQCMTKLAAVCEQSPARMRLKQVVVMME